MKSLLADVATQPLTGIPANRSARNGKTKTDKLPAKLQGLIDAITAGILAAATAPQGTVNAADYLNPGQIRHLCRLAEKKGQTPRQYLQSIVDHVTGKVRRHKTSTASAGGAA